jgi:hypothetical protein
LKQLKSQSNHQLIKNAGDAGITEMMLDIILSIQLYVGAAPATCLVMAKNATLPKITEGESFGSL